MSDLIEASLAEATDTKRVEMGAGAVGKVAEVFTSLFPGRRAVIIGDERTMRVAGDAVREVLASEGVELLESHVFPGEPELYARYENIEALRDQLAGLDAVAIAVGAGTLNDIVKRASGELDRGYMIVGTAASMDGYTAFGASIAVDGFKQTLGCPAPRACIADLTVMAAAPANMTASGYGDLLGKVTSGADWILADALGVEAMNDSVWAKVQGTLADAVGNPEGLAAREVDAVGALAEGLIMSGLAMQAHQSSRPASGAEHQFSHLWEMEGHGVDQVPRLSHGFKVALGTVAVAALYEELLAMDVAADLDVDAAVAAWRSREDLEAHVRQLNPNPRLVDETVEQTLAKWIPAEELRARLESLKSSWATIAPRLRAQLLPATELQRRLRAVGAPAHPSDIDLDWERFRQTYLRAQTIRKRYTVLDVLFEAGLLEPLVERLFAADGFWGRQRP
ncbi:sn-glycerol-1-phosphate dehydrogenase [Tessaracoccus sp. G1721]